MGISRKSDFASGKCYQALQDGVRYTVTYDELKEHCLKAQDAAIERGDQLFHARQRIYELEAQIRSTMPVVVDLVAGANAIEGVPSTHLMQQWKIEQAKAFAEAWVLKWK